MAGGHLGIEAELGVQHSTLQPSWPMAGGHLGVEAELSVQHSTLQPSRTHPGAVPTSTGGGGQGDIDGEGGMRQRHCRQ